jgi:hypothetical protein
MVLILVKKRKPPGLNALFTRTFVFFCKLMLHLRQQVNIAAVKHIYVKPNTSVYRSGDSQELIPL